MARAFLLLLSCAAARRTLLQQHAELPVVSDLVEWPRRGFVL